MDKEICTCGLNTDEPSNRHLFTCKLYRHAFHDGFGRTYYKPDELAKALCIQWRGDNFGEVAELDRNIFGPYGQENAHLIAFTLNGREKVSIGDWVNKDNNGDLTVIKAA